MPENASDSCDRPFGTWFVDFGVRGLACVAQRGVPLEQVAGRAGTDVFRSGPHRVGAHGLGLVMTDDRAFGRYNPAFVRWAVAQAVPSRPDDIARTQRTYDAHVQRLARAYWLALGSLRADGFPAALQPGPAKTYALYLRGGDVPPDVAGWEGGVSVYSLFHEQAEPLLASLPGVTDDEWGARYELNTAFGFWLRRSDDGTWEIFRDGLVALLTAYDADWLAQHGG
jgi:hypothetical protein